MKVTGSGWGRVFAGEHFSSSKRAGLALTTLPRVAPAKLGCDANLATLDVAFAGERFRPLRRAAASQCNVVHERLGRSGGSSGLARSPANGSR
jgi:hypothetical protein